MKYNPKYNRDLLEIIKLIEENKIHGQGEALDKFQLHIKEIIKLGRFASNTWVHDWRASVYDLGTKFKKLNPIDFLNALTTEKTGKNKDEQEILDFYFSEIEFNTLPDESCTSKMRDLVVKYPYNPEFRHTFGHFYSRIKEYEKAIEQYKFAFDKDKTNKSFVDSLFFTYQRYLETLIDNSEYQKGLELCEQLTKDKIFWDKAIYHNYLFGLKERFKDYILLNEKIDNAEIKIKEIISKETQKGQVKIIEILGFFTAIIAFIFSTVSIGKNFKFEEAIIFNIALGLTLMSFVLMLNLIFSSKTIKFTDPKLLMLIVIIMSLLLIVTKFGVPLWIN